MKNRELGILERRTPIGTAAHLALVFLQVVKRRGPWAKLPERHSGEGHVGSRVHLVQIGNVFVHIKQARDHLALALMFIQEREHLLAVGGIIIRRDTLESDHAAVMHGHVDRAVLTDVGQDFAGLMEPDFDGAAGNRRDGQVLSVRGEPHAPARDADVVGAVRQLLPYSDKAPTGFANAGGADWVFDCVGNAGIVRNGVEMLDWGGNLVILGVPPPDAELSTLFARLTHVDRGIIGCRYGSVRPHADITMIVEAAAGTGKTTELVRRIVAVVASGRTTLDKIVAVTFTEKAAGELKLRVREQIEKRRRTTAEAAERFLLDGALEKLEEAHISTIHSFCRDLLVERPVEAGIDPLFEVAPQDEADAMLRAAFDRWFEQALQSPGPGLRRMLARAEGDREETPTGWIFSAALELSRWRDFPARWDRPPFEREAELEALFTEMSTIGEIFRSSSAPQPPNGEAPAAAREAFDLRTGSAWGWTIPMALLRARPGRSLMLGYYRSAKLRR